MGETTNMHPKWKVKKYDYVVGAYDGKKTNGL